MIFGRKKEDENIKIYRNSSQEQLFSYGEDKLYDISKSLREQNNLPKASFQPNNPYSYSELIVNKPKNQSPTGAALSFLKENRVTQAVSDSLSTTVQLGKSVGGAVKDTASFLGGRLKSGFKDSIDTTAQLGVSGLGVAAKTFDKPIDVAIKKPVASTYLAGSAVYFNAKETYNSFFKDSDFDYIGASVKFEDHKEKVEYLFSTESKISDYFSFNTFSEKRQNLLKDKTEEEKEEFKKLDGWAIGIDVISGLATGIGSTKALAPLIAKGGKLGTVAKVLDETINPSLNNLARLGALTAAVGIPYYAITKNNLFEDNLAAQEGAFAALGGLGLKGLGGSYKGVKALFNNPDFQKGVQTFNKNLGDVIEPSVNRFAKYTGAKANFLPDEQVLKSTDLTPARKKEVYKIGKELKALQDLEIETGVKGLKYQSLPEKKGYLKELIEDGLVRYDGQDAKGARFLFSDEYGKIVFGKRYDATRPVVNHLPIEESADLIKLSPKIELPTAPIKKTSEIIPDDLYQTKPSTKEDWLTERAKNSGLWDDKKSKLSNLSNYIESRVFSKLVKNEDRLLGERAGDVGVKYLVKPAQRNIQKQLEGSALFGKVESVKKEFEGLYKLLGEEVDDFNNYAFLKSRWAKTIAEQKAGRELKTAKTINGKLTPLAAEDLKAGWEIKDGKYSKILEKVSALNKRVLDYELSVGVRSQKEVDNFLKTNPYYIPDKAEADFLDTLIRAPGFKPEAVKLGKGLKGGSESFDFDTNALDNLYKSISYRLNIGARNEKILTALNVAPDDIRVATKEITGKKGFITTKAFIDGKEKWIEGPKFWIDAINRNDGVELGTVTRALSLPTVALKNWYTGKFAPIFQAVAPIYEVPLALMHNLSNKGGSINFIKSLFSTKDSFLGTPAGAEALRSLARDIGGDYSYRKLLQDEWSKSFKNNTSVKNYHKTKNLAIKAGNWINDKVDFGHTLEMKTTRLPVLESQLKKQGITTKLWTKLVEESNGDGNKLTRLLQENGVDTKDISYIVRNIFDYQVASKQLHTVSRFLGYLNTSVAATTSMKKLWEANPLKFYQYLAGGVLASQIMYNYNYEGEKGDLIRKQGEWITHGVGFNFISEDGDKVYTARLGKNIPLVEWMYPLVVELNEGDPDFSKAFDKMFGDVSYFGDLNKPFGVDTSKILPSGLKQIREAQTNKDFFFDTDLVGQFQERPGFESNVYKSSTAPIYRSISRNIALLTGGEIDENGIIIGGNQIYPEKIKKIFSIGDPKGYLERIKFFSNELDRKGYNENTAKTLKSEFGALLKEYRLSTTSDLYQNPSSEDLYYKVRQDKYRGILNTTQTEDQLKEKAREIVAGITDDKEKKYVGDLINENRVRLKFGDRAVREVKMTARELGASLANTYSEKGEQAAKDRLKQLIEYGVISDAKIRNIFKEYKRLIDSTQ